MAKYESLRPINRVLTMFRTPLVRIVAFAAGLACAGLATSAQAAVTWPAGHIVRGAWSSSQGANRISFAVSGDTTLQVMQRSSATYSWCGNALSAGGYIGGNEFFSGSYGAWAPGGPGTLLMLECVSTAQLSLRGFTWSGSALPTTTITGPGNSFNNGINYWGTPADGDGAWFLWQGGAGRPGVRLLRATATGGIAPGWPTFGRRIAASGASQYRDPGLAADGSGGAVVALVQDVVRAYRVNADSTFAAGWPAGGLALEEPGLDYTIVGHVELTRSDATHFIASWIGYLAPGYYLKCQRFSLDGSLDPGWPTDGVIVRDPYAGGPDYFDFQVVSDGAGGATLAWKDSSRVCVRHVREDGTFGAGYADGPASAVGTSEWTTSGGLGFGLATGRTGGAVVVFVNPQGDLRGRWWDADGAPDPDPVHYDARFFTAAELDAVNAGYYSRGSRAVSAMSDGEGGAYFGWTGGEWLGYVPYVFASHAPWPGAALLAVPPPASPTLALAVGPNPARGALTARFTLPDARPAQLELLDLAGRRVAAREVAGAGAHAETFAEAAALPPGVYLLRLAHGGAVRTARVAVIR